MADYGDDGFTGRNSDLHVFLWGFWTGAGGPLPNNGDHLALLEMVNQALANGNHCTLRGTCDSTGSADQNWRLGVRRAQSIKQFIMDRWGWDDSFFDIHNPIVQPSGNGEP